MARSRSLLLLAAITLTCVAATCTNDDVVTDDVSSTALWISDVHFNPFYNGTSLTPLVDTSSQTPTWKDGSEWAAIFDDMGGSQGDAPSPRGVDANHRLFQDVLARAASTRPDPDFILLTGDLLGHGFGSDYQASAPSDSASLGYTLQTGAAYDQFVAQTLRYVASSIRAVYPDESIPIIATLGNNDAYCGDYDIRTDVPASDFLNDTAETLFRYLLPGVTGTDSTALRSSFMDGGYYAMDLPGSPGSRMIVLNSVTYMDAYSAGTDAIYRWADVYDKVESLCQAKPKVDPAEQAEWAQRELDKGGQAWFAMHVPPGLDCYSSAGPAFTSDWLSSNLDPFLALFEPGATTTTIQGAFAAHSHMASYKLIHGDSGPLSFVLQGPSIGSNHSNNAAFSVLTYDPATLAIEDLEVHYLSLSPSTTSVPPGSWGAFAFAGIDGPITTASLDSVYQAIPDTSSSAWLNFALSYGVQSNPSLTDTTSLQLNDLTRANTECLMVTSQP